jgi:hypothetical protein
MIGTRQRQMIALSALAAGLAAPAVADDAAAQKARVEYRDTFTTRTPGAPAGRTFDASIFDAADPDAKPPPLSHVRYEMPVGARFDTGAVPRCTASDAQIVAEGASACEPASKVGTGVVLIDSGLPEPDRILTEDFTVFNGNGDVIAMSQDRKNGARVVLHAKVSERAIDLDVPPLPGTPPDGGANRQEHFDYTAATGPGGAFLTTPPTCPADGAWVLTATWTFRNGEKVTRESRSPCDSAGAGGGAPAAQRLTFFRRQHARAGRAGSLRLRAARATAATVTVTRGARTVARRSLRLRAGLNRIAVPAVGRGRYTVVVSASGVKREATLVVR